MEAEALLEGDGQFLVRESAKRPGQYVLTGMANGTPQHLLLMDKHGKVREGGGGGGGGEYSHSSTPLYYPHR